MEDVVKVYDNGVTAIDGLSATIDQGEFVFLVGPSGAGKSTFIKFIYCEEVPTSGYVMVGDFDITKIRKSEIPYLRRQVGVVFQDFKLLPNLTVYENVAYAMQVLEKSTRRIKERVQEVLELVHLENKAQMKPAELSGGEQQRVSIARAIANMPLVLIADEPTGNLDPETSWEIMNILEEINAQGTTVIMATHHKEIVDQMKHRVIALEDGRKVRDEERGGYGYEN